MSGRVNPRWPLDSFDKPATKRIFTRDGRELVVSALEIETTVREDLHEQIEVARRKDAMRPWVRACLKDLCEVATYDQRHHPRPPVPTRTGVVVPADFLADAADAAEQRAVQLMLSEVFREEFARSEYFTPLGAAGVLSLEFNVSLPPKTP